MTIAEAHMIAPSVKSILDLWPSRKDVAADIGVDAAAVRGWVYRNFIPGEYDVALVQSARMRNLPVTFELLAFMRSARHHQGGSDA